MTLIQKYAGPGWEDEIHPTNPRNPDGSVNRRRRIGGKGFMYWTPGATQWQRSEPSMQPSQGVPPDWEGSYDFEDEDLDSACQKFSKSTTPGRSHMFGIRRADEPGSWLNILWTGAVSGISPVYAADRKSFTYTGLYTDCVLHCAAGADRLTQTMYLNSLSAPTTFDVSLRAPGRLTFDVDENARKVRLLNADGEERLFIEYCAIDSATVAIDDVGAPVGLTLTNLDPSQGNHIVRVTLDPNDMATAILPVRIVS